MDLSPRPGLSQALHFLAGAALFAVIYGQAPLYYSNQNQYFLHGLAQADVGRLRDDWLAHTLDPTPVFSALVAVTARFLPLATFHVYHALLQGAYAAALLGVSVALAGTTRRSLVFLALLALSHAALTRWLSYRLFGLDYPWYLQSGVAGQYVLGAMLQPSVFGVLLVAAVALFAYERPYLAALCLAAGATVHSTYLLPAGLLALGFQAALWHEGKTRTALGVGALALLLVLPAVAYVWLQFAPTSPETFAAAQSILVNVRIPHHARPDLWFDPIAGLQTAWVALALALVWRRRLFLALAVPSALAVLLTLVQVASGSDTLALLFPWRVSAVLVPIATGIVLTRLANVPWLPLDGRAARVGAGTVVALLAAAGLWIVADRQAFRVSDDELPVMAFVRDNQQPGDVYLLPVRIPDLSKTRGSLSSDFKPVAAKRQDVRVIPIDLQRFRLHAEAPIHVDFKSIPYQDVEVIEWHHRLLQAQAWQAQVGTKGEGATLAELRRHGITHLVVPAQVTTGLRAVYADAVYRVDRLE